MVEDRLLKSIVKWYSLGIKKRKGRPETTWMKENSGIIDEIALGKRIE